MIDTADNKDMVKEWYEGLFASDLDEEEIETNLAYILESMTQTVKDACMVKPVIKPVPPLVILKLFFCTT